MIDENAFAPVVGDLERPADAGKGEAGQVKLWLKALQLADKEEEKWRERGAQVLKWYRDAQNSNDIERQRYKYNILYSNTETMAPALYNSDPIPDIRRRFGEADPVAKAASLVLERAVTFGIDQYNFSNVMKLGIKDFLLPGRTVIRVRYKPYTEKRNERISAIQGANGYTRSDGTPIESSVQIQKDEEGEYIEGEPYDAVTYEEAYCEHVQWDDFRRGPGKTWDEVPWIAFRHHLTRDQFIKLNKQVGARIQLDESIMGDDKPQDGSATPDIFKRGVCWEIWDKATKKVTFIAPAWKDGPILEQDDPLGLSCFFPIPRPLYAVESPDTLVPCELFRLYRSQADELDTLTRRLTALTKVMKWRGIYATADDGTNYLDQLRTSMDGDLTPSQSAFALAQQGGISNYIWIMPIDQLAAVIDKLSLRVEQVKNNIYEIMGIADILRGSTKASETASAQQIKAQWGSLRLSNMQTEVQRYARDLIRMMCEIIGEKFSPETLAKMTGLELPSAQQLQQQAQQMVMQARMQGQQVDPQQIQQLQAQPTWDAVMALLKDDALRSFRIDIETDSTIQADVAKAQKNIADFIGGFAQFVAAVGPAVQQGALPQQAAVAMLKSFARVFKLPRQATDALDNLPEQGQQGGEQQNQGEAIKAQAEQQKAAAQLQQTQMDGQIAAQKGQMDLQKMQLDAQMAQQQHAFDMEYLAASHQARMAELAAKAAQPKPKPEQRVQ